MNRNVFLGAAVALIVAGMSSLSTTAKAQGPDIRAIPPVVMMLVDSSGSMEKLGNCACVTPACTECLPNCAVGSPDRNRWNSIVEALTGTYQDFTCVSQDRNSPSFAGEPDFRYFLPHIAASWSSQNNDGVFDVYRERVRFGLMTFDATSTFLNQGELMTQTNFLARGLAANAAIDGGFSYGERRPFSFPGCGEPYMIDNGARNEGAPDDGGRLVSVGREGTDLIGDVNQAVQLALTGDGVTRPALRPYGATPIAGMLSDLDYYFSNHPDVRENNLGTNGDPFFQCRTRFGILLTDGRPNQDMRGAPMFCEAMGNGVGALGCPYDTPTNLAAQMVAAEDIEGLYVVGFDVDGTNCGGDPDCVARANQAVAELNDIAAAGGTTSALFVSDRASLVAALGGILDRTAPGTTTRTVPAFANVAVSASAGPQSQLQINTGFNVSVQERDPWSGKLERRRIECDGLTPVTRDIEARDRFHETISNQTSPPSGLSYGQARALFTATPPSVGDFDAHITNNAIRSDVTSRVPITPPGSRGESIGSWNTSSPSTHFWSDNTALDDAMFAVGGPGEVTDIFEWTHGIATVREDKKLGAIVHSSPVVVGPPQLDIADDSFNEFRQLAVVRNRPTVMYVGTNDGILHAINTVDYCPADGDPNCSTGETVEIAEGTELWGFVPPMLYRKFGTLLAAHQWMVDGSPIVREMFDARLLGSGAADSYRTVLTIGMRQGGNGFVALDVTNPLEPEFMWQYADPDFGETYGNPGLAQVRVDIGSVIHERGIAILPGGRGETLPGACSPAGAAVPGTIDGVGSPRSQRRCWQSTGRSLVILDVATGAVLRKWDASTFPAPLSGSVAVFPGSTGALASRAYVTDADGVIWRIDLSSPDPANWEARAFHDIFHGAAANAGQPAYNRPIVSVNANNEVVLLQATGDVDRLEDVTAENRVISITEELTFDASGAVIAVGGQLNWQITLQPGEQVTGPLELFESNVFFGSFVASNDAVDACQVGFSRLWGAEFVGNITAGNTPGEFLPTGALDDGGTPTLNIGPGDLPTL
ncbi:MAG: PilC/PilY family type IV pilus protein, partial [Myxococcota bacterium]